jgi:putative spermidine/putrescine transport system permease protein
MKLRVFWLLLPAGVLAVLLAAALAFLVAESFGTTRAGQPVLVWSPATWLQTITGDYFWGIMGRTSLLGLVVASLGVLIGYPTALALLQLKASRTRLILFALIFSPLLISAVVRVYAWSLVLGPSGVLRSLLVPLSGGAGNPFASFAGVTIVLVQNLIPLAVFPILAALRRIEGQLAEAAHVLGATPFQAFLRVTLPMTAPTVIAVFEIIFIVSVSAFAIPTLVGQGHVQVLASDVYQEVLASNWSLASVEVIVLLTLSGVVIAVGGWLSGRQTASMPTSVMGE